jgi:hypothetical protein
MIVHKSLLEGENLYYKMMIGDWQKKAPAAMCKFLLMTMVGVLSTGTISLAQGSESSPGRS